jgi:UDP-N-acetyl-2-amino-2-deoxyglucuronate dehydrogenase
MRTKLIQDLKVGVVGCGGVSGLHAMAIKQSGAQLIGGCALRQQSADSFAAKHGCKAFYNLAELLKEVDAITVGTRPPQHANIAVPALLAGKHVLVEKPFAANLSQCDQMISAAKKGGALLGGISQRRWLEPLQRAKRAIEAGKLGTPALCLTRMIGNRSDAYYGEPWNWRGRWKTEGGALLLNQAPHPIDHALWLMGSEPKRLIGTWTNVSHEALIEAEDSASAILELKNGATINFFYTNSAAPPPHGEVTLEIVGSNRANICIRTDGPMFVAKIGEKSQMQEPPRLNVWAIDGESEYLGTWNVEDSEEFIARGDDATQHYHTLQFKDFFDAITENRAPTVTAIEARRSVEIAMAIYRSQITGGWVEWPLEPDPIDDQFEMRRYTALTGS